MMLRKITVLLSALAMMMVMSMPVALAHHDAGGHVKENNGNQLDDGLDHNKGGGNDAIESNNGKGND
jgi:hypothetical protein